MKPSLHQQMKRDAENISVSQNPKERTMSEFHSHAPNSQTCWHCHSHDLQSSAHCHSHNLQDNGRRHCHGLPQHKHLDGHDLSGAFSSDDSPKASTCRWFCNIARGECLKPGSSLSSDACPWTACREPRKCDPLVKRSDVIDFIRKAGKICTVACRRHTGLIFEDECGRLVQYFCTYKNNPSIFTCLQFGDDCSSCRYGKALYL